MKKKNGELSSQVKAVILVLTTMAAAAIIIFALIFPYIGDLFVKKHREEMKGIVNSYGIMLDSMADIDGVTEEEMWESLYRINDDKIFPDPFLVNLETEHKIAPDGEHGPYPDIWDFDEEGYAQHSVNGNSYYEACYTVKGGKIGIYMSATHKDIVAELKPAKIIVAITLVLVALVSGIAAYFLCRTEEE